MGGENFVRGHQVDDGRQGSNEGQKSQQLSAKARLTLLA
jgi:hypothetical protein